MLGAPIVTAPGFSLFPRPFLTHKALVTRRGAAGRSLLMVKEVGDIPSPSAPCLAGGPGLQISHLCLIKKGKQEHPLHVSSQIF